MTDVTGVAIRVSFCVLLRGRTLRECAPHSFFSSCRKERTRRARCKKEKGARGLQSFGHRRPRGIAYALALLRSMSIPPYFHSKRLSFPGESRGNPKGARKPRLVVSIRVGPGRGKGTSPPPVASVSPQHFSGTARWTENEISPPCRICHSRACFATARQHPRVPSLAAVRQFTLWRGCGNCGLASPATGSARPQFPSLVSFSLVPFFWTSKRKVHHRPE